MKYLEINLTKDVYYLYGENIKLYVDSQNLNCPSTVEWINCGIFYNKTLRGNDYEQVTHK